MEELNFDDLEPRVVLVRLGGKEYFLREANGDAVAKWRAATLAGSSHTGERMEFGPGVADSDPLLVQLCLFDKMPDGGQSPIPAFTLKQVRAMKSSIIRKLFDKVKEMSGLDEEESAAEIKKRIDCDLKRLKKMEAEDTAPKASRDGIDVGV